ncbi:MAG: hypothetical protein AB7S38_26960 [Vulcanimicrobiota bacterium]
MVNSSIRNSNPRPALNVRAAAAETGPKASEKIGGLKERQGDNPAKLEPPVQGPIRSESLIDVIA